MSEQSQRYDLAQTLTKGTRDLALNVAVVAGVAVVAYLGDVDVVKHVLSGAHVPDALAVTLALLLKSVATMLQDYFKHATPGPGK